jgi:predicted sulfurtransferase
MRLLIFLACGFLLVALVLTACNSTERVTQTAPAPDISPPQTIHADGVRRITTGELQVLLAKNEAVVIDVRNQEMFNLGHIKGAKLIPASEILEHAAELPRDKLIVTYCS